MRIDIGKGGRRGWLQKAGLYLIRKYIGIIPGPMLFLTYDSAQIPRGVIRYMMRGVAKHGAFSKGERELFAAFVSNLNSCRF
ncbi:MAG: hypothetical protein GY903_32065 [Fuerstiella sp.]|nr:hypothetical protein [Fuerstiella sp.]MCP4859128.1 hypothetical protein [Fuerstiella sp.]